MITIEEGVKIANAAKTWLGTPHVNGAKVKGIGVDCAMLMLACVEDAGLAKRGDVYVKPYSNEWHLHRSEEMFLQTVEKFCVQVKEARPGDFLLYRYGRCVSHGAIYIGAGRVIHSLIDQGVVMAERESFCFLDAKGKSRLYGIFRFKGAGET